MVFRATIYALVFLGSIVIFAKVRSARIRQAILLIGSYAVYLTWGAWFAAVLLASTVMNFFLGCWLRRKASALALTVGTVLNLALLTCFKYLPGVAIDMPFASLQRFSHLALPLGMSFWTFQAMSYLFDLYRDEELDPTFFEFALYMVFFPVTISGPICRIPDMLPQFRYDQPTRWNDIGRGFRRVAIGVLMMQLARLLGQGILGGDGINSGFDHVSRWSGPDVWCLTFGYGLQLFFDFAGYSHIAIGAAQMLGFTIPENFSRPFASTTPSIFWTRWHMSLSFWIRDYVFLPLAMLRREVWWRNLALLISMVIFGLWHKATTLFVLWGCYHGVLLVLHRQVQNLQRTFEWKLPEPLWTVVSWMSTIGLVSLGWIYFRANSLTEVSQMLSAVFSLGSYTGHFLSGSLYLLVGALAAGYAAALTIGEALNRHSGEGADSQSQSGVVALIARWRWYWLPPIYAITLLFVLIITLTRGADTAQLMYRGF